MTMAHDYRGFERQDEINREKEAAQQKIRAMVYEELQKELANKEKIRKQNRKPKEILEEEKFAIIELNNKYQYVYCEGYLISFVESLRTFSTRDFCYYNNNLEYNDSKYAGDKKYAIDIIYNKRMKPIWKRYDF